VRPNPFDRSTTISFATPARGARLEIYDAAGRRVRNLIDDQRAAGVHTVVWDGQSDAGARVAPGVYYARLRSGAQTAVKSMVVVE
jgi:flagellar hook assembly protein FlgD